METAGKSKERFPKLELIAPVAEIWTEPAAAAELWPLEASDPEFIHQLDGRNQARQAFESVVQSIARPDQPIQEALNVGVVNEQQVIDLYSNLSQILKDADYARLALYLPFELLPAQTWDPESKNLSSAVKEFKQAYMEAWASLLATHDVRANFVDGDVLEVDQRTDDLPRVVKAAHLIPQLINKGLLSMPEVLDLANTTKDPVLKNSIEDALEFINAPARQESQSEPVTFLTVRGQLDDFINGLGDTNYDGLTKKRIDWLKKDQTNKKVKELASHLAARLTQGGLSAEELNGFLTDQTDSLAKQVLVEAVRKSVEALAPTNLAAAHNIYIQNHTLLRELWAQNDPTVKNLLVKTSRHFYRLGLVGKYELESAGISLPNLKGELSDNLRRPTAEMQKIETIVRAIEQSSQLSTLIYPVSLVFGSRLKGYGETNADVDLAVFVRPGVEPKARQELRQLLDNILKTNGQQDSAIEFWLDQVDDQLKIHDSADFDPLIGESHWAHVLFGAAWVGSAAAVKELQQHLLPGYFYETSDQVYGRNERQLWLEEIERDTLQYRLMHNGYERHYPRANKVDLARASTIDGASLFWDSGYRRLASCLFIDKVFLPKLAKK